jgi:glycosyltransferase involved in cell wall biosynthesis
VLDGSRLLVVVPALNEAATIQGVIAAIPRDIPGIAETQVLVIDDGSSDDTADLARAAGAEVISHFRTFGVGVAIQRGLSEAVQRSADIAVNIDGDGQFNPDDIRVLIQPILARRADFVTASRFKDPRLTPQMPFLKRQGNLWMSRLISVITGQRFWDVSCGFRAYSGEALLRLALQGRFTYTQESFLVLSFKGAAIVEVPIAVRGSREHGRSRVASSLWLYAIRTGSIIFSCFRDYRPSLVFNGISATMLALALAFGTFFLGHRVLSGAFTPHIWSGFVAAGFFSIGFAVFLAGQLAAMINRLRLLQEEQLYLLRLWYQRQDDRDPSTEKPAAADRR